ncbi:hypothetical protein HDV00_010800, partial [Rhizophlyctis rosea]
SEESADVDIPLAKFNQYSAHTPERTSSARTPEGRASPVPNSSDTFFGRDVTPLPTFAPSQPKSPAQEAAEKLTSIIQRKGDAFVADPVAQQAVKVIEEQMSITQRSGESNPFEAPMTLADLDDRAPATKYVSPYRPVVPFYSSTMLDRTPAKSGYSRPFDPNARKRVKTRILQPIRYFGSGFSSNRPAKSSYQRKQKLSAALLDPGPVEVEGKGKGKRVHLDNGIVESGNVVDSAPIRKKFRRELSAETGSRTPDHPMPAVREAGSALNGSTLKESIAAKSISSVLNNDAYLPPEPAAAWSKVSLSKPGYMDRIFGGKMTEDATANSSSEPEVHSTRKEAEASKTTATNLSTPQTKAAEAKAPEPKASASKPFQFTPTASKPPVVPAEKPSAFAIPITPPKSAPKVNSAAPVTQAPVKPAEPTASTFSFAKPPSSESVSKTTATSTVQTFSFANTPAKPVAKSTAIVESKKDIQASVPVEEVSLTSGASAQKRPQVASEEGSNVREVLEKVRRLSNGQLPTFNLLKSSPETFRSNAIWKQAEERVSSTNAKEIPVFDLSKPAPKAQQLPSQIPVFPPSLKKPFTSILEPPKRETSKTPASDSSSSSSKSGKAAAPASAKWTCSVCLVNNESDKSSCVACATPKPGSKSDAAPAPSTAGGFTFGGSTLASATAGWTCNECLVPNKVGANVCVACSTAKPGTKSTAAAPPASTAGGFSFGGSTSASASAGWTCSECLVPNKADATSCVACSSAKPGAKPSTAASVGGFGSGGGFSFKAAGTASAPAGWTCDVCLVSNKAETNKCAACDTPKPGAKSSAAPAAGLAPGGGFSFGGASVKSAPVSSEGFSFGGGAVSAAPAFSFGGFTVGGEKKDAPAAPAFSFGGSTVGGDKMDLAAASAGDAAGGSGGSVFGTSSQAPAAFSFGNAQKQESQKKGAPNAAGSSTAFAFGGGNVSASSAFGGFATPSAESKKVETTKETPATTTAAPVGTGGFSFLGALNNKAASTTPAPPASTPDKREKAPISFSQTSSGKSVGGGTAAARSLLSMFGPAPTPSGTSSEVGLETPSRSLTATSGKEGGLRKSRSVSPCAETIGPENDGQNGSQQKGGKTQVPPSTPGGDGSAFGAFGKIGGEGGAGTGSAFGGSGSPFGAFGGGTSPFGSASPFGGAAGTGSAFGSPGASGVTGGFSPFGTGQLSVGFSFAKPEEKDGEVEDEGGKK